MNNDDLQKISKLLDTKLAASEDRLEKKFDTKLAATEERIEGKFDKELAASEERLKKHTTEAVQKLSNDVGDFIAEKLIPMIEEKADKSDIDRLERKLDRVLDTSIDHESRIKAIEQLPVIAHELRAKKHK